MFEINRHSHNIYKSYIYSMKILQIDDFQSLIEPIKTIFESNNFEYESATNGKDGIDLIRKNDYDLVLLDLTMPIMSGYEVIDQLGKENMITKQKILVFTAKYLDNDEVKELEDKGVYSIIQKPISIEELEAIVVDVIEGHRVVKMIKPYNRLFKIQ